MGCSPRQPAEAGGSARQHLLAGAALHVPVAQHKREALGADALLLVERRDELGTRRQVGWLLLCARLQHAKAASA